MASKLYLLVAEGPTDIVTINEIAQKVAESTDSIIEIRELVPQRDATGRYPDSGWKEIEQWCKLYGNTDTSQMEALEAFAVQRKQWAAVVKAANADGLIIQIDTDIAQYIQNVSTSFTGTTKQDRKDFLKEAICTWLNEHTIPNDIHLVLSTYSTETWVLSTHDRINEVFNDLSEDFDFEDIDNVVDRLKVLGYTTYVDPYTDRVKLSKKLHLYKRYAESIATNLEKVREECEEVDNLYKKLAN